VEEQQELLKSECLLTQLLPLLLGCVLLICYLRDTPVWHQGLMLHFSCLPCQVLSVGVADE